MVNLSEFWKSYVYNLVSALSVPQFSPFFIFGYCCIVICYSSQGLGKTSLFFFFTSQII